MDEGAFDSPDGTPDGGYCGGVDAGGWLEASRLCPSETNSARAKTYSQEFFWPVATAFWK